jgi:hypothetical protein
MSDDGTVVGGDSGPTNNMGTVNIKSAMIWTAETGMVYVTDYLTMKGVTDHKSWDALLKTVYISPDGKTVVGTGYKPYPSQSTWIMTLK